LLIGIWALGFAAIVAMRLGEWIRIRRLVKDARPLAIEFPVPVRCSTAAIEPGIFGILRPVLLLPKRLLAQLSRSQLRPILAHEAHHVGRHDNLTALIHMSVEAAFWFHPLVWWIGKQLMLERERACDEHVLRSGSDREDYAESILTVCKACIPSPIAC